MWWIFPVGSLCLCIIFNIAKRVKREEVGMFDNLGFITSAMTIMMPVILLIMFASTLETGQCVENNTVVTKNLYTFTDTSERVSEGYGNIFFWGFTSQDVYKYRYVTDGNIGKVIEEDDISSFEIIDNENTNPRIEYHTYTYMRDGWVAWMFGKKGGSFTIKVAYIPKGSLVYDFNVDLE